MVVTPRPATQNDLERFLEQELHKSLLRFTTAGSVDDGKSTLIGRLLHDCNGVYEDQLDSVKKSRINRSGKSIDLSLLTDGLRAEREQGITIDVAYRYFSTALRKFIIADTPGHQQYTRNMATGASTADLAVILIDSTKGLLTQTRRHTFIASLLGMGHVVAAVNKMDLRGYHEEVFLKIERDFHGLTELLGLAGARCIPISALEGDNIVRPSARMSWYQGPTLLEHLETVPIPSPGFGQSLRLPVQMVVRPDASFRGYAGRIASGVIRPGDEVLALPSGQKSRVHSLVSYEGNQLLAHAPMSVTLRLEDEIDLSRGDMLVSPEDPPRVSRTFRAMTVWLHANPLRPGQSYLIKQTVRQAKVQARQIHHRVNVNTLAEEPATHLCMNDIALVEYEANTPLFFDPYSANRPTGSFILIDLVSNATVAAGMIQESPRRIPSVAISEGHNFENVLVHERVNAAERFARNGHYAGAVVLKGRPRLAAGLERLLFQEGLQVAGIQDRQLTRNSGAMVFRTLASAGLVIIYSGDQITKQDKEAIAAEFPNRNLDLSEANLDSDDEVAARQAFELVKTLCVINSSSSAVEAGKWNAPIHSGIRERAKWPKSS
jgi:sulfate adenylyltransferase subunit 1